MIEVPVEFTGKISKCPFCRGKARVSHREVKFLGQDEFEVKLIKTAFYCMCNKCYCRGPSIFADIHYWNGNSRKELEDCYIKAINKWNERCNESTQEMLQEANLE